jgi:Rho-binding antiterminator
MKSDEIIQGTAVDTQQNNNREECIKLNIDGTERLIVLSEIKNLEVTEDNPHVQVVVF